MTSDLPLTHQYITHHLPSLSQPQSCVKCALGWNVTNHSSGSNPEQGIRAKTGASGWVWSSVTGSQQVCFCFFLSHKIPFFGTREAKCFGMNSMDPPQIKVITLCNKLEKVHTLLHKLQDVT